MASFSIRAARPEDCSDLLRLIKVRAAAGGRGGGEAAGPGPAERKQGVAQGRGGVSGPGEAADLLRSSRN